MRDKERSSNNFLRSCSNQSDTFITPEHRKFRRVHGLQLPLHPQQIIGWIVISIIIINTFVVLMPHIQSNLRSILTMVITGIFVIHACSHLIVLLMDPADPRVRSQPTNKILPEFDRGKHLHVIENGRCHLCNITTDNQRTKHCSICNKCIVRFDHHCKWLNNCIGARNYLAFLVCMVSAILASLFVAGLSITELTFSFFDGPWNYMQTNRITDDSTTNIIGPPIIPVSDTATLIAIFAIGILSATSAILLLHLCFFHGYIACLGLTTYEYVRKRREKNSVATAVVIAAAAAAAATAAPTSDAVGEAATVAVSNTIAITVDPSIVKLPGDTIYTNSSSAKTVAKSPSGDGLSEISSTRYHHRSIMRNNTNLYPFQGTRGQIVFRARLKAILIRSLFSYCKSKREMAHYCISRRVECSQFNQSSREIRATIIEHQSAPITKNLTADLLISQNRAEKLKDNQQEESTRRCVALERIETCFRRAYLINDNANTKCKVNANTCQRSIGIKLNTFDGTMSDMTACGGTENQIFSKNIGSIVGSPLAHLDKAIAIIESHPSEKFRNVHPASATQPNDDDTDDRITVRLRETFGPPARKRHFVTRVASPQKATTKMSHMLPPINLSPILESELTSPVTHPSSFNPLQGPSSAHSTLFTYTSPPTTRLSRVETLSSIDPPPSFADM